jgi:TonB family protein
MQRGVMMAHGFGFIAMLLLSTLASAATAAPREPAGKWNVAFDDAQCVASRTYGTAEEPLHLVLKAPPVGGVMQIAVLRNGGYAEAAQVGATIAIDEQPPLKTNVLMFSPKKSKTRVYTLNLPSSDFSRIRGAKSLSIRSSGLNESFSVSQMESLLKVMDQCVADLRRVWNVSTVDGGTSALPKPAKANLAKLFSDEDYPGFAVMEGASGVVRFVILIDEAGKVADCTVVETSGVAGLDAQSCAILRLRGKFEPGVGHDGKPAKDVYVGTIRWRLTS